MNNKIRILLIGMSPNYGGTENFLLNIFRNANHDKYEFVFLNVFDKPLAKEDEIKFMGGSIANLSLRRREGLPKYRKDLQAFYNENNFDIVHLNVQSMENIDMLKYAKKIGIKKRILYVHNCGFGMKVGIFTRFLHYFNRLFISLYATNLYAVSDKAMKWAIPFWKYKKTQIIPNSISWTDFKFNTAKRENLRKQYNISPKIKVYGNVGRMDYQKNHLFLLKVFSEILKREPNSKLIIIGDGELKNNIKYICKELNLEKSVILPGFVDNVCDFYSMFDLFLYPTKFEGFGIVLLEAQASGLPIIASNRIPKNVILSKRIKTISLLKKSKWIKDALSQKKLKENERENIDFIPNNNYDYNKLYE